MKKLLFVTGNPLKVEQIAKYLRFPVDHIKLELDEIQAPNLATVIKDKALRAYALVGKPVLVEDTGLFFNALNGMPGPFIKWFLGGVGNEKLTKMLDGFSDRSAIAETCFALCDETGIHIFSGACEGSIARIPRGTTRFGWNPIFIPEGESKTWAEMEEAEKPFNSMRQLALEKLQVYLEEHYQ
jgi:non-canonical purine NTP pyrophosphatase (RdgB/HAM1 family)